MFVTGSFNDWNDEVELLKEDGKFRKSIPLDDGHYEYKYIVDGKWMHDPNSPNMVNDMGSYNNYVDIRT